MWKPSFLSKQEIIDVKSTSRKISKDQNVDTEVTHFMSMTLVAGMLASYAQDIELLWMLSS